MVRRDIRIVEARVRFPVSPQNKIMIIKTIQWNIGGGKIRDINSSVEGPYDISGIDYIIEFLRRYNPDIITLQEIHSDDKIIQSEIIAKELGLLYSINDVYDKSHIEDGQGLGQAIISRFPINDHNFKFFFNPHLEIVRPNGNKWLSHDKGVSKCLVEVEKGIKMQIVTLHLVPFRRFGVDPLEEKFESLRSNIAELSKPSDNIFLLQGDFNFDDSSLRKFIPSLFEKNISEVLLNEPTTPKGRKYDHILYRDIKHIRSEVVSTTLTDHFPIFSEFEI